MNDWDLYDKLGQRKYLTTDERLEFFNAITPALSDANGRIKRTFQNAILYKVQDLRRLKHYSKKY